MTTPVKQCAMCRGTGFIFYTDSDSCDVQPCDCTYPVEVKK